MTGLWRRFRCSQAASRKVVHEKKRWRISGKLSTSTLKIVLLPVTRFLWRTRANTLSLSRYSADELLTDRVRRAVHVRDYAGLLRIV